MIEVKPEERIFGHIYVVLKPQYIDVVKCVKLYDSEFIHHTFQGRSMIHNNTYQGDNHFFRKGYTFFDTGLTKCDDPKRLVREFKMKYPELLV